MSLRKTALFAFGLVAFLVADNKIADAAPGAAINEHPSALGSGTLVYIPDDAAFGHANGGRWHQTPGFRFDLP